jgi:hypothetical protein
MEAVSPYCGFRVELMEVIAMARDGRSTPKRRSFRWERPSRSMRA